jgi:hypothetical protein
MRYAMGLHRGYDPRIVDLFSSDSQRRYKSKPMIKDQRNIHDKGEAGDRFSDFRLHSLGLPTESVDVDGPRRHTPELNDHLRKKA